MTDYEKSLAQVTPTRQDAAEPSVHNGRVMLGLSSGHITILVMAVWKISSNTVKEGSSNNYSVKCSTNYNWYPESDVGVNDKDQRSRVASC